MRLVRQHPYVTTAIALILVWVLASVIVAWRDSGSPATTSDDQAGQLGTSEAWQAGWYERAAAWPEAIADDLAPVSGEPRLAAPRGIVLVNIWASTCGPCRREMPALQRLAATHPGIHVVGITRDSRLSAARRLIRETKVTYPNYADPDGDFLMALKGAAPLSILPTTVVVEGGRVHWVHVGQFSSYADLLSGITSRSTAS